MLNQIQACGCGIYVSLAQSLLQILKIPIQQQNNLNFANVQNFFHWASPKKISVEILC